MKKKKNKDTRYIAPINHLIFLSLSCSPLLATANAYTTMLPKPVFSIKDPKLSMPRVSIIGQYGNYGIGQVDLFTPFLRSDTSIAFFDLRATATAESNQIYSGALGFRTIMGNNHKAIIGAHIWDDRKHSQYGNFFNQAVLGIEYFGNIYSLTSNVYVPYGDRQQFAYATGIIPFATGHTVGYFENASTEDVLRGADFEVGKQDLIDRHLRVYADYYHFGVSDDDQRMNGCRIRSEYIIENKWLHRLDSNVMLTASLQYDNIEHAAGFAGIRVNIGKDYNPTDPLVGRLEEYIFRDNDIVTEMGFTNTSITDPNTFIFVDNTKPAGGDGTRERPYNNEEEAISNSRPGNIIYTFQGIGNYSMPGGGLALKQNQVFFGSGSDYIFNNVVILPKTSAPTLNGRINVDNGDTINGITLSGDGSSENIGIYGNNVSNITIRNTTIEDFSGTDANGTPGAPGGVGGNAYGIQILNSNNVLLNQVTINNIMGGDANGGNADDGEYAFGGNGGTGGNAIGIDLSTSSNVALSNVSVTSIIGGDANGGSATNADVSVYGGNGGNAGNARGIDLTGSSAVILNNISVSTLSGGDANGGLASGTDLNDVAYGGNGGIAGSATGIDLTGASISSISNISIIGITGGSANGGDAIALGVPGNGSYGGNGGTGGNAIGIKGISSIPPTVTINSITGGSANAGAASGSTTNTPGTAGTDGIANAVQP